MSRADAVEESANDELRRVLSPFHRNAGGLLGRAGRADRLENAARPDPRLRPGRPSCAGSPAARPTSATTRSTGTWRRARRPAGADLRLHRDRHREAATPSRNCTPKCSASPPRCMALGVGKGDRVLIYMPMIAEAAFAMLACARIGAIHCVVFGGFASASLASRIEDATPKVVVSADAGSRGGKVIAYKPLLDEAIRLSKHKPRGRAAGRPRPGAHGPDARAATMTGARSARRSTATRRCPAPGWTPPTSATPSTPAAPPAGPRACSATPAATRWRWPPA